MKIAIISDIHDNEPYLTAFLAYCKNNAVDQLIICGDVGNLDTLKQISTSFNGLIYFVMGNADTFLERDIPKNIIDLGEMAIITLDNKKIGLCHQPYKAKNLLLDKPDIIFYGHTHEPWIEQQGKTLLVNPGTLGGWYNQSTFAIWDTTKPMPELVKTEI